MKNKERRSVCFFNTGKSWGGGEEWHFTSAAWLHAHGWSVTIIGQRDSSFVRRCHGEGLSCEEIIAGNLSFLNLVLLFRLVRIFKQTAPSFVLMAMPIDVKLGGIAAAIAGVMHRIFRRGSAIPVKDKWLNRWLYRVVITDIIANSKATIETILQNNASLFPRQRIKLLYNPVPVPVLEEKHDRLSDTKFHIGTAGRLEPQKNQEFLIPLALDLKKRGLNFAIFIAGSGSLYNHLFDKIAEAGLEDQVYLDGFKEDIYSFMQELHVFVLPSKWEGFGYVLAQAMSIGLPVVAFDLSNMPELVRDGENGYLVPPYNISIFGDKVEILLKDMALRAEMGRKGRDFVANNFDKEFIMNELQDYLLSL